MAKTVLDKEGVECAVESEQHWPVSLLLQPVFCHRQVHRAAIAIVVVFGESADLEKHRVHAGRFVGCGSVWIGHELLAGLVVGWLLFVVLVSLGVQA